MSNLLNKAKDALSGNKSHDTTTTSSGHHTTGASVNTADPNYTSTTGTHSTYQGGQGLGGGSTNAGPHNSNLANKLDPRVDSDRDNRNDPTSRVGGYGTQDTYGGTTGGYTGTTGAGGVTGTTGHTTTTTAGPHNSNLLNKADPRVDSDRDHRNDPTSRAGGYGTQDTYGGTTGHTSHTGSGGLTGTTGHTSGSTNAGPHNSNLANKMDPRVDSDRDNRNDPTSRVGGYGTQDTYGTTGSNIGGAGAGGLTGTTGHTTHGHTGGISGTTGHTGTGYDHKQTGLEGPNVAHTTGTHGAGTAGNTVGMESQRVHDSSLLNKLDPKTKTDSQGRPI